MIPCDYHFNPDERTHDVRVRDYPEVNASTMEGPPVRGSIETLLQDLIGAWIRHLPSLDVPSPGDFELIPAEAWRA